MLEKKKTTAQLAGPGSGDALFGELGGAPPAAGVATVIHGTYAEALPVAEMSVAQIRRRFTDLLDIHPESVPILDGAAAGEDTTVHAGQSLMFVRRSGEKGAA
jgi:hypothetical protein